MKTLLAVVAFAAALTVTMAAPTAPAFAQAGNIAGTESRGEPINSSVRLSARDPRTGVTPGGMASHAKAHVKKKKRVTSKTSVRPSGQY
jgi:hypothetical protein